MSTTKTEAQLKALTKEQLTNFADDLGLELDANANKDAMIQAILQYQLDVFGVVGDGTVVGDDGLGPATGDTGAPDSSAQTGAAAGESAAPSAKKPAKPDPNAKLWVRIKVAADDASPVFLCNGNDNVHVPRGSWVHMAKKFIVVLQDAIESRLVDGKYRDVRRYEFDLHDGPTPPDEQDRTTRVVLD